MLLNMSKRNILHQRLASNTSTAESKLQQAMSARARAQEAHAEKAAIENLVQAKKAVAPVLKALESGMRGKNCHVAKKNQELSNEMLAAALAANNGEQASSGSTKRHLKIITPSHDSAVTEAAEAAVRPASPGGEFPGRSLSPRQFAERPNFSKVLYIVTLRSKHTRALTFEILFFCGRLRPYSASSAGSGGGEGGGRGGDPPGSMAVHVYQAGGGGAARGGERERQEFRRGDARMARGISAQRERERERVYEVLAAPGLPPKPRPSSGMTASRVQASRVISLKGGGVGVGGGRGRLGFDSPGGPSGWDNLATPEHNRRSTIVEWLGQYRDAGAQSRAHDQLDRYLEQ